MLAFVKFLILLLIFLSQCILCVLCLFSTLSHGEDALQISIIIVTMTAYAQPAHTDKTFPYTSSLLLLIPTYLLLHICINKQKSKVTISYAHSVNNYSTLLNHTTFQLAALFCNVENVSKSLKPI